MIASLYSSGNRGLFESLVHKMVKDIKFDCKLQRMSFLNTDVNENILNESLLQQKSAAGPGLVVCHC